MRARVMDPTIGRTREIRKVLPDADEATAYYLGATSCWLGPLGGSGTSGCSSCAALAVIDVTGGGSYQFGCDTIVPGTTPPAGGTQSGCQAVAVCY